MCKKIMTEFKKGDFARINGAAVVIVGVEGDDNVPEDHVAVWYGSDENKKAKENSSIEIWTVPVDVCVKAEVDEINH